MCYQLVSKMAQLNTVCLGMALKTYEIDNGRDRVLIINAPEAVAAVAKPNWVLTASGGKGVIKDCSALMALERYKGYRGLVYYHRHNDDALATTLRVAAAKINSAVVIGEFNVQHPLITKHWTVCQAVVVGIPRFFVLYRI